MSDIIIYENATIEIGVIRPLFITFIEPNIIHNLFFAANIRFFLETTKKIERNLQLISKLPQKPVNYKLLTVNCYSPGGPSPHNHGEGFDAPPTLERSGSEHREGAVTSLALLERARAWEWVKDPPVGEEQVGQKLLFL